MWVAPNSSSEVQLGVDDVDTDDRVGAGEGGSLDSIEADAPASQNRHALARLDAGCIYYRPEAGGDRASDQCREIERKVLSDTHRSRSSGTTMKGA